MSRNIAGKTVTLTAPVPVPLALPLAFDIKLPEKTLQITLPADAPSLLFSFLNTPDDWEAYSSQTCAMVLEHQIAPAFADIEGNAGAEFQLLPSQQIIAPQIGLSIILDEAMELVVGLGGDTELINRFINSMTFDTITNSRMNFAALPFQVQLFGPDFAISRQSLATACRGDGFLLERDWSALDHAQLVIGDALFAQVKRDNSGFALIHKPQPISYPVRKENFDMSVEPTDQNSSADQLPVVIQIELAQATLTFADLSQLNTGSLLPFGKELPSTVGLLANGKRFGRGELVRLNDQIAVRLTELD